MKKILLAIMAVTAINNFCYAQEETDHRDIMMFGIKGGVNYSNVYDTKGEAFVADPKFGFAGGAFLAIPIGKYLGVQPEVLFSRKGFQATGIILGSNYSLTRTTSFIDVPLLISFKPAKALTILGGPQFSYLMKQKDVFASGSTSYLQEQEFKNDNLRKNVMCFLGGIDIGLNQLVLGARVGWDIQNNTGTGTSTTPRYKNMWYQATLGYRFYSD